MLHLWCPLAGDEHLAVFRFLKLEEPEEAPPAEAPVEVPVEVPEESQEQEAQS
jgi:hypothetical protein